MRHMHISPRLRWIALVMAASVALAGWSIQAAVIGGDRLLAKPILDALTKAYNEEKKPKDKLRVVCRGDWEIAEAFGRGQSEALLSVGPLFDGATTIIAQQSPDGNFIKWEKLEIGQVKVIAIVHSSNTLTGLNLEQIQKLLAGKTGPGMTWKDMGGKGGLVTCYGEHEESTSRLILRDRVMRFTNRSEPGSPGVRYGGFDIFRDNLALCADAQEVIDEVARDRNGIGFITFAGRLPKEVRALRLAEKLGAPYVAPRLEPVTQREYPLGSPVLLHLHPSATQTTRDFARWAASAAGTKVLATACGYDAATPPANKDPRGNPPATKPAIPATKPSRPTATGTQPSR